MKENTKIFIGKNIVLALMILALYIAKKFGGFESVYILSISMIYAELVFKK